WRRLENSCTAWDNVPRSWTCSVAGGCPNKRRGSLPACSSGVPVRSA
ncbi:MAG: hypothetical protein AVDCRST_MAG55-2070, partial [uncultured Rubrobacteraceae bacterium]